MVITLPEIKDYVFCPRYYYLNKEDPAFHSISIRQSIIESIIKQCLLNITKKGKMIDWRKIVGLVDAAIFSDLDSMENKEGYEKGRTLAEQILKSLQKWYQAIYPTLAPYDAFIDLKIKRRIFDSIYLEDTVPIIQLANDIPYITIIREDINPFRLRNDIILRGLAWLVSQELGVSEVTVIALSIGERGGLDIYYPITTNTDMNTRTRKTLTDIVCSIKEKRDWLTTSSCHACPFTIGRCKL